MHSNQDTADSARLSLERELVPYMDIYQLDQLPFTSTINDKQFYPGGSREQHLHQLSHLIQSSDMVLVVVGEMGSGKTSLARQFLSQNTAGIKSCYLQAHRDMTPTAAMAEICRCYDLPDTLQVAPAMELLKQHAGMLNQSDQTPVILIDDAQQLPEQTLELLLQMQIDHDHPDNGMDWHLVLLADKSMSPRLISRETHLHFIQLAPFDIDETREYLIHRMALAGLQGTFPFSQKDIDQIYRHSQGNIGKIHQYAHELLLKKHPPARSSKSSRKQPPTPHTGRQWNRFFKPAYLLLLLLIPGLAAVVYFQDDINQLFKQNSNKTAVSQPAYLVKSIPYPVQSIAKDYVRPPEEPEQAKQTKPTVTTASQAQTPVAKPKPKSKLAQPAAPPAVVKQDADNKSKPAGKLQQQLARQDIHDAQWVLKQPADNVTAQLMASTKPDSLIQLVRNSKLHQDAAIYFVSRSNGDWYVLVHGSYADRDQANQALKQLPTRLQRSKPWVRPFSVIQKEIRSIQQP